MGIGKCVGVKGVSSDFVDVFVNFDFVVFEVVFVIDDSDELSCVGILKFFGIDDLDIKRKREGIIDDFLSNIIGNDG